MDLDLEIISEESDCPDPLFDSIMNAMNSMKEATADKIYQKIQKEGETNYSKPQVGRALASALKYGIFEVKNNRYRVRDDILDDEDTVYWSLQKQREQTPFRIQENINDRQLGPKLDPERDNQRFKSIGNDIAKQKECPHCGRIKRPKRERTQKRRVPGYSKTPRKRRKQPEKERAKTQSSSRKRALARKAYAKSRSKKLSSKETSIKKLYGGIIDDKKEMKDSENGPREAEIQPVEPFDTSDSETDFVSPLSNDQSLKSGSEDSKSKYPNRSNKSRSLLSLECVDVEDVKAKRSSTSKFDSESDQMDVSSMSFGQSRAGDPYFESLPCTSRTASGNERDQYLGSTEIYTNQYEANQTDQCQEKSDWLECTNEPQGTVILSNNALKIEPMDSLAFKSPKQASYIS